MKRRALTLLLAAVAALALMVGMTGSSLASPNDASPYQPPLTALSKTGPASTLEGVPIPYVVTFTIGTTGNVVIEDSFLHGLDLVGPAALWGIVPVGPCAVIPVTPCVKQTASYLDRNTYEFLLGTVPALVPQTLTFAGIVNEEYPLNNPYVKDTLNFYWNGQWKGKASSITSVIE